MWENASRKCKYFLPALLLRTDRVCVYTFMSKFFGKQRIVRFKMNKLKMKKLAEDCEFSVQCISWNEQIVLPKFNCTCTSM